MGKRKHPGYYSDMDDQEFIGYVRDNYFGLSLNSLRIRNGTVYRYLKKRNLTERLIKQKVLVRVKNGRTFYGEWKNVDFAISQANKFLEENPEYKILPGKTVLRKKGYQSLAVAIVKYHEGFISFRKLMGAFFPKKEDHYWKSEENILREAVDAMKKEGWDELPSARVLRSRGYSAMGSSAVKYHGGIPALRQRLNDYLGKPSSGERLEGVLESYVGVGGAA
jgi:small nuclear ribonucleoprotein (snRNP)-like protein